ncbi:MAG TPA: PDGLE domain-containing protein [Polyangia bacterium]|jgi:hypothetical protein
MRGRRLAVVLLALAVVLAAAGVHLASRAPDGLERAAHDLGIAAVAPAERGDHVRLSLSALLGVGATLAAGLGAGRLLARRRPTPPAG